LFNRLVEPADAGSQRKENTQRSLKNVHFAYEVLLL
jgi:hypothetical protein